jgi:hypothetical protein
MGRFKPGDVIRCLENAAWQKLLLMEDHVIVLEAILGAKLGIDRTHSYLSEFRYYWVLDESSTVKRILEKYEEANQLS